LKKRGIVLIIILGLLGILAGGTYYYVQAQVSDPSLVETTPLSKGSLQETISTTGIVESQSVHKVSDSSGQIIDRVYVEVGDWVGNGDWLCELYNEAEDSYTTVKAETSGTITDIAAVIGAMANGELFTIQDTNDLKVIGKIKETDLNKIYKNMNVLVTSDAIADQVITGLLSSIAPTAIKTETTDSTKASEFEFTVDLPADSAGLKIGMTTDLNIVSQEKNDVFCLPFDMLVMDASGSPCIYSAAPANDESGSYIVEAINVTTGLETDTQIEIAGEGLSEGLLVIKQPQIVEPGQTISIGDGQ
jgi:HlyD family secretion protein